MADETVASLGFEVNSKPLDDAKQKLAEVSTEANKTGKAVDDFNAKVGNTGAAASKAADGVGKVGPAFGAIESAANRAGISVEAMRSRAAAFSAETAKLATSSVAAGSAIGSIAKEAGAIAPALNAVGAATAAVTKEHNAHNSALSSLRGNLRGMSPLLSQFGSGLGDILQFSRAARLGLEGLALVAGGAVLLALEKISDEVNRTKNSLAGLTESTQGGAKAYDALKGAAKSSGVEIGALKSAVDSAIIGQEKFADKNVISANTAENLTNKYKAATDAFATFGSVLHGNQATAEEENRALKALGDSFKETGTLTADAFRKIRAESEKGALDLANIFGFQHVKDFVAELERAPKTLDEFKQRMALVKPQVDATLNPETPKNFGQALRGVGTAWDEMWKSLSGGDTARGVLKLIADDLRSVTDAIKKSQEGLDDDSKFGMFIKGVKEIGSTLGALKDIIVDGVWPALKSIGDIIMGGVVPGLQAIGTFVMDAIGMLGRLATTAVEVAKTTASAIASIAKGGGGNPAGLSGGGNPFNTDQTGAVMGGTGGASDGLEGIQLSPSGDAGTIDAGNLGGGTGGFTDNLPAFASGGQFTVEGSGGTDSQVVSFKSTPGEVVTVSTPEQIALQSTGAISGVTTQSQPSAVGVVSATPEPAAVASVKEITDAIDKSSIDITKKMLLGSDAIVTELKKLTGGVAASTVNPATGLPIANMIKAPNGSLVPSSVTGGSGGGGGFTAKGLNADYGAEARAMEKAFAALNGTTPNSAYSSLVTGAYARSIKGYAGSISGAPTGQFAPVNPSYNPANYNSGYNSGGYGGDPYTGSYYPQADPMNSGGYDGAYPSVDPMAGYDSGSAYSGTGDTVYGSNSAGSNYSSDYGGSSGFFFGPSGADPNVMNYGGGSVDAGYFATGGSFTVPGSAGGGVDKTLVVMHNTPGETVTVTPNGVTVPSVGSQAPKNDDPSSQANITNKTVNIHVQAGIQAESFIRSRAQIARGF